MQTLVIATRGSKLALRQAEYVKKRLLAACPFVASVELLAVKTKGDALLDAPLAKIGGKGLFVKEIEEALLDGRADLAVHSMKDVPMDLPETLCLAAVLEREDPRDLFLSMRCPDLASLPRGARVGTCSLRRQAGLLALRPDLTVTALRGNVDTRLAKLAAGEYDAILVAAAGMKRLGLAAPFMAALSPDSMLPAAGQGALGLECRADRPELAATLRRLDHAETRLCVTAERGFLAGLGGGCQTPMAAHARIEAGTLALDALLARADGSECIRKTARMAAEKGKEHARSLGLSLAQTIRHSGGDALLAALFAAENP
ncbi:MAG: hydroxymethylbilane synthase [Deltaproteobacteria bacterium]|nr:hydroxymethylbilane synthase [Deltaproteobacteria bacterium]